MYKQMKNVFFLMGLLLLLSRCMSQSSSVSLFDVVFPLNEYVTTNSTSPYPVLVENKLKQINTSSFVNVMNFGAAGDGTRADDDAIVKAFAACKNNGGVLFPKGKNFLIQNLVRIPLTKNITVYAYGASIKMANNTGYNAIAFEGNDNGYSNQVLWLGGLFDGNKSKQSWPGSPTGNNQWTVTESNYGLLTIKRAKFALVKDISLVNSVYDGVDLFECELGVIADSQAEDGVQFQYAKIRDEFEHGRQATYFKATRKGSKTAYFLNLTCKGGSIGIHFSSKPANDSSLAVVTNCRLYNQVQDALHFEHCKKVFVDHLSVEADNYSFYHDRVHLSNTTEIAAVTNSTFKNGRVDFRNAAMLKSGVVYQCTFYSSGRNTEKSVVDNFIQNATHVFNCSFDGPTETGQVLAKVVNQSKFKNFNLAVRNANIINQSVFENGNNVVKPGMEAVLSKCTFANVKDKPATAMSTLKSRNERVQNVALPEINIRDENGNTLGKITP